MGGQGHEDRLAASLTQVGTQRRRRAGGVTGEAGAISRAAYLGDVDWRQRR